MSRNIIIKRSSKCPDGWDAQWKDGEVRITSPAGTSVLITEMTAISEIDDSRLIRTGDIVIVYGYQDHTTGSCSSGPSTQSCKCTIPPTKDPECFNYFKRDFPEYANKDKHDINDFFPL
jgi:hypothetical protein